MNISRFILVRHGETEANKQGLFYGGTDLPLTEHGCQQAADIASYLNEAQIDKVLTSDLLRTKQTAEYIRSSKNYQYESHSHLNEMYFGDWEMQHHSQIALDFADDWKVWVDDWQHATPTNGESFPCFAERIQMAADRLRDEAIDVPANRLVVAHKGVIGIILCRWLGLPAKAMWQFPCQQGCYSVVESHNGYMTLSVFNGRSPLHL